MRKIVALILATAVTLAEPRSLVGQEPERFPVLKRGLPEDVGVSEAILSAGLELFTKAVENDEIKGAVVLVARRGKIIAHEAFGFADAENGRPMEIGTLFRMASNTKPLIGVATMQLVEEERLGVRDLVHRTIPSFDNHRTGGVRVEHMLCHTSGFRIGGVFFQPLLGKSENRPGAPSLQTEVDRFARYGIEEDPGRTYHYCNVGYNTLGAMIEIKAKMPLGRYFKEKIYRPLYMNESSNHEDVADRERMGKVYRKREGKWRIHWAPDRPAPYPFVRGSGGLISTAHDYARFCQMFLNGGGYGKNRILKAKSVQEIMAPHTRSIYTAREISRRPSFYGYGWHVDKKGVCAHSGADGTYAWIDPKQEVIGLVLTQSRGGKNPRRQFQRVVDAACYDD